MTATHSPSRNGTKPAALDLDIATGSPGRRRVPEIAAGVLVVLVFAVAALLWQTSTNEPRPVLALRGPIERGHTLTAADLHVVGIETDDSVAVLTDRQAAQVVGRVARGDLAAGTLVTADLFSASSLIGSGDGVVGLALEAGQFPSLRLATGDAVAVVVTPAASDPRGFDAAAAPNVLVPRATVVEVERIGVQDRMFISVQVGEADAARVAAAASANRVRLIQVGEG